MKALPWAPWPAFLTGAHVPFMEPRVPTLMPFTDLKHTPKSLILNDFWRYLLREEIKVPKSMCGVLSCV